MNRKLPILAAIVGAAVILAAAAVAQIVSIPQVTIINPADRIQIVPQGGPRVGNVYASPAQLTAQSGYYKSAPATGFTFTFGNTQTYAAFNPSTTLSTGTVTMPPGPSDGARECIYSDQIISTLTVSANTGQTINDAVTTLAAAGHACYLYSLSNATWDRVE